MHIVKISRKTIAVFVFCIVSVIVPVVLGRTDVFVSEAGCRQCGGGSCVACSDNGTCNCSAYCADGCHDDINGTTGVCQGNEAGCGLPAIGCDCGNSATCTPDPKPVPCENNCPCTAPTCRSEFGSDWSEGLAPEGVDPDDWSEACKDETSCLASGEGIQPDCPTCDDWRPCYREEPHDTPAQVPSSMYYCVGSTTPSNCVALSKNPSSPTQVLPPDPGTTIYLKSATVGNPGGTWYAIEFMTTPGVWQQDPYISIPGVSLSFGVVYHTAAAAAIHRVCDLGDPYSCVGGYPDCDTVDGYFSLNHPPEITNVRVVNSECTLPDGSLSRWTGDPATNPGGVNNPLLVEVTARDIDGWEDISTVYLTIAPPAAKFELPWNCYDELKGFVNLGFWPAFYSQVGLETSVVMSEPHGSCTPNCRFSPSGAAVTDAASCEALNGGTGCSWDENQASYWVPYGSCGCMRDYNELGYGGLSSDGVTPLYQFDSSCQYPTGEITGCNECYFDTMHPDYTVLDITPSGTGDTLTVLYELEFANSFPEGQMQMYAMARNMPNMFSGGDNPGCSDTDPCRTTHSNWTWGFDFGAPSPVSVSAQHIGTDDPNTMRFDQEAADGSPYDSGLRRVYDRTYWIDREGEGHIPPGSTFLIGNPINFSTYTPSWSTQSAPVPGFEGGDVVHANISAMDMACNISTNSYESDQIGHEWIQTRGGDVYSGGTYFDPIQIEGDALSTYWLGGAGTASCASGNFGGGIGSDQSPWWCSNGYTDGNLRSIRGNWYDTLYRLALGSDWLEQNQGGEILPVSSLNFASAADGVYEYSGEGLLVTGECRGRKMVFVPNSQAAVDVTVRPDFQTDQPDAACVIVAEHGSVIQIVGGSSAPGDIDYVDAAFITDGTFQVLKDDVPPVYDRLVIDGFVFSDTSDFLRDLVFADNLEYAAETIEYDPRYLMLLKDMVGRRPIRDFECGIVKGSSMCEGWWVE